MHGSRPGFLLRSSSSSSSLRKASDQRWRSISSWAPGVTGGSGSMDSSEDEMTTHSARVTSVKSSSVSSSAELRSDWDESSLLSGHVSVDTGLQVSFSRGSVQRVRAERPPPDVRLSERCTLPSSSASCLPVSPSPSC